MNFRGCRDKTQTQIRDKPGCPPPAAEVLVAVRGPSPRLSGGGKKGGQRCFRADLLAVEELLL